MNSIKNIFFLLKIKNFPSKNTYFLSWLESTFHQLNFLKFIQHKRNLKNDFQAICCQDFLFLNKRFIIDILT
jgi:hypothetical protein